MTLKSEQEEYAREGITWTQIPFFNNRVVCELIEGSVLPGGPRIPPGVFALLDDVCATMHAESKGSEKAFVEKVCTVHGGHAHLAGSSSSGGGGKAGFVVKHFAGNVEYSAADFPPKNADAVSNDLVLAMSVSTKRLVALLFNEEIDLDSKKRAPTAGSKIRNQTKELVKHLMSSNPHYIRTIVSARHWLRGTWGVLAGWTLRGARRRNAGRGRPGVVTRALSLSRTCVRCVCFLSWRLAPLALQTSHPEIQRQQTGQPIRLPTCTFPNQVPRTPREPTSASSGVCVS